MFLISKEDFILGLLFVFEFIFPGSPYPDIIWYKDEIKLKESSRVRIYCEHETYILEIRDAQKSDSGRYKVTAYNSEGETSRKVSVNVASEARKPR